MSSDVDSPANPTYKQVCKGDSGHVEVFHMRFDRRRTTYEALVKHLFTFHDPTTLNS